MEFLAFKDAHYTRRKPASRKDDYGLSIREKMIQIGTVTRARKISAVFFAGDLFHHKRPSQVSHEEVQDLLSIFSDYACPVLLIPGNHDLSSAGYSSLKKQPLGDLTSSKLVHLLTPKDPYDVEESGIKVRIYGVPWDERNQVRSFDFKREDENIQIVLGHVSIIPKGGYVSGIQAFSYADFAACNFDVFITGHIHTDHGITMLQGKHYVNIGSLSRNTIHYDNRDRIPQIAHIAIDEAANVKIQPVALKAKSGAEVFDLEKKMESEEEQKQIMEFLEDLSKSNMTSTVYSEELKSMKLDRPVLEKVNTYIQESEGEEEFGTENLKEIRV